MNSKKVALITGASAGIGKELAQIHAERGGDLIIVARREDKLNDLKKELENKHNISVAVIAKDLGHTRAAAEVYDEVKRLGIEVDYLINNAGFGDLAKFHESQLQKNLNMINLNIAALTALTHHFLQDFVKRNDGKVLNVSSTASLLPGPLQAVYFATKAYVTSFSNALVEELCDTNVTVSNLMPGATDTEFGNAAGMEKSPLFQNAVGARKVALEGYNGMLKGKMDIISGLTFAQKVMMFMIPVTPKKMLLSQMRKMQEVKA